VSRWTSNFTPPADHLVNGLTTTVKHYILAAS